MQNFHHKQFGQRRDVLDHRATKGQFVHFAEPFKDGDITDEAVGKVQPVYFVGFFNGLTSETNVP